MQERTELLVEPNAETLLSSVYDLLGSVLKQANLHPDYAMAMQRVIDAAHASERAGFPLSLLPLLTCQACGGTAEQALPVAAAWRALHIAAKLLDDVEDGDVDCEAGLQMPLARVINTATGFIALANLVLIRLPAAIQMIVLDEVQRAVLHTAAGQHADISLAAHISLDQYFAVMAMKSGECFALASRAGARCGSDDPQRINELHQFGYNIGVIVQITDDLGGLFHTHGRSDIAAGQRSLPIRYALFVAAPAQRQLLEHLLVTAPHDPVAEADAREMIVALGAAPYLITELARHQRRASTALDEACGQTGATDPLRQWLSTLTRASA